MWWVVIVKKKVCENVVISKVCEPIKICYFNILKKCCKKFINFFFWKTKKKKKIITITLLIKELMALLRGAKCNFIKQNC